MNKKYGKWHYPISNVVWWRELIRVLINPNPAAAPYKLSRLTRIVFLLDPASYYVWPHPRIETMEWRNVGTILARLIVTVKNPGLEAREIPYYSAKTIGQTGADPAVKMDQDLDWRWKMFRTYGDKWPLNETVIS